MKLITSTILKPRRKATKIKAGISGPVLPVGLYMSCVAVDTMRLAWMGDWMSCCMLHLTGKYTFRLLHWDSQQMQAFQGVGPITILLGQRLHSSLEHMAVPQPSEMYILWIESLHIAGNCHSIQGVWRLGHSHYRGDCHSTEKAENYHRKFTMGISKLPKDKGPLPRACHRGVRCWLTNTCISKCMSECMIGWKQRMRKPS